MNEEKAMTGGGVSGSDAVSEWVDSIPIVLGVTGHRDIPVSDFPILQAAVAKVFAKARAIAPNSRDSMLLLTPLAEGADRLVARQALAEGMRIQVILPLEQHEYEKDFESSESVSEFRALLSRSAFSPVLAPTVLTSSEEELLAARDRESVTQVERDRLDVEKAALLRRAAYRSAGRMVCRYSQIMLALWDGKDKASSAGTSAIVRYALRREEVSAAFGPVRDPSNRSWVAHVWTRRATVTDESTGMKEVPGRIRWIQPDWLGVKTFDAALESLDDIDADACDVIQQIDRLNGDLQTAEFRQTSGLLITTSEEWQQAWLQRIEALAQHWQSRRDNIFKRLLFLGVGGFAFLQASAHAFAGIWPLLAVFFSLTVIAWLHLRHHEGRSNENRHLDYRGFAEGLRVQQILNVAGISGDVSSLYPHRRQPCLEWIRASLRTLDFMSFRFSPARAVRSDSGWDEIDRAFREWVEGQISYFQKAIHRLDRKRRYLEHLASTCIGLGLLSALVLLVLHVLGEVEPHDSVQGWLVLVASLMMTIGASAEVYSEQRALFETSGEYRRMIEIFRNYRLELHDLRTAGELDAVRRALVLLAREALAENASWVTLHRSRHLKVPIGG
jgi:hypothetical protein